MFNVKNKDNKCSFNSRARIFIHRSRLILS